MGTIISIQHMRKFIRWLVQRVRLNKSGTQLNSGGAQVTGMHRRAPISIGWIKKKRSESDSQTSKTVVSTFC